jgi:hypothetical protein
MIDIIVRRIHLGYNVVAFPILVAKETGLNTTQANIPDSEGISVEECAEKMLKVVDAATTETHGGKIFTHEGKQLASAILVGKELDCERMAFCRSTR